MFKLKDRDIGFEQSPPIRGEGRKPAAALLLLVRGQEVSVTDDRVRLNRSLTVGREHRCDLTLEDPCMSAVHFRVALGDDKSYIEDIDSTNGTYINGCRVEGKAPLPSGSLIRAGTCLFVFHEDGEHLLAPEIRSDTMVGPFHLRSYLEPLIKTARAGHHVLITGPLGVGKELAARTFAREAGLEMLSHEALRHGSESETAATLFGVVSGMYTDEFPRIGLIERAQGKVLFFDKAHNYPLRVQESLCRVLADNRIKPIGGDADREVYVRYVFSSGAPGPDYGLVHDLVSQLRVVEIPSLADRIADVPAIFLRVVQDVLDPLGMSRVLVAGLFGTDHYESLCLDGFPEDNIRGLIRLGEELTEEIIERGDLTVQVAVDRVFARRYGDGPVANRTYLRTVDTRRLTVPPPSSRGPE